MADPTTWITYHLPRTRVRIHGTLTEKLNLRTGKPAKEVASQVALETEADPAVYYRLELHGSKLSDSSLSLELTDDGLLVSTEAKSTGRLGQIVKNVFSFVTTIAGVAGRLAGFPLALEAAEPDAEEEEGEPSVLDLYGAEHPKQARRRAEITEVLDRLSGKLLELENQLAEKEDAEARKKIVAHVTDLKQAVERLREEAGLLDTHFTAWKSNSEAATTTAFELTVPLDDLPKISDVEQWTSAPTVDQLKGFAPVYRSLDLVLARADVLPLPSGGVTQEPVAGRQYPGVFFRQARPIELALYTMYGKPKLIKKTSELVMDTSCRTGFVEFKVTKWSEKLAMLEFSDLGALKKLKGEKTSELAAATGSLKELPAEVLASLEQANKIIDQQQALSLQGIDHRIVELQKQKSLLDSEITLGDAIDTRDQAQEVKRIKAEIDLLKARKDLGDAQRQLQLVGEGSAIQLETEILKLRVGLEEAQIERLKTEAELEKLQAAKKE